jgi:hypothetical protein
MKRRS